MISSGSLWSFNQVSERPMKSCLSGTIKSVINGTFDWTVCGARPCTFIKEKVEISFGWLDAGCDLLAQSASCSLLLDFWLAVVDLLQAFVLNAVVALSVAFVE